MAQGISLHIGVNRCDPEHYSGWDGPLAACENDADVIAEIAHTQGFAVQSLKTGTATRGAVAAAIRAAAEQLAAGDFFLISYSGHGGQITDVDGDEEDRIDETWCLYDGQMLDDELSLLWAQFAEGVRVLVLSDSCHSGSIAKRAVAANPAQSGSAVAMRGVSRDMPVRAARQTARKNRDFYASIQQALPVPRPEIRASIRQFSGCMDDQLSYEVDGSGVFTRNLKTAWNDGAFTGNYQDFYRVILAAMPEGQDPNHLKIGRRDRVYDEQRPFSI